MPGGPPHRGVVQQPPGVGGRRARVADGTCPPDGCCELLQPWPLLAAGLEHRDGWRPARAPRGHGPGWCRRCRRDRPAANRAPRTSGSVRPGRAATSARARVRASGLGSKRASAASRYRPVRVRLWRGCARRRKGRGPCPCSGGTGRPSCGRSRLRGRVERDGPVEQGPRDRLQLAGRGLKARGSAGPGRAGRAPPRRSPRPHHTAARRPCGPEGTCLCTVAVASPGARAARSGGTSCSSRVFPREGLPPRAVRHRRQATRASCSALALPSSSSGQAGASVASLPSGDGDGVASCR